jgi:5'-nucleotidase
LGDNAFVRAFHSGARLEPGDVLTFALQETATREPVRTADPAHLLTRREQEIADLIADGMKWRYGTQLALMNSGGVRSQMPACSYTPVDHTLNRAGWNAAHTAVSTCSGYAAGTPYDIVLGDIFTVLPFGNILNTRTVTGKQIWDALENGVSAFASDGTNGQGRYPAVSGFKFTFHYQSPTGCVGNAVTFTWTSCSPSRVTAVTLDDGTPIPYSTSATYTMALPNFVNLGGDGYFMFNDGQGATQELDALVMQAYMAAVGPNFDPLANPLDRAVKLP